MGSGFRIHLENIIRRVLEGWLENREKNPKTFASTGVPAHEVALQIQKAYREAHMKGFVSGATWAADAIIAEGDFNVAVAAQEYVDRLESNDF